MFLRIWRLLAWLPTVLLGTVWLAGFATAQTRDPPIGLDRSGYLRAVFFVNARTGWAVGNGGVTATRDAGLTWHDQSGGHGLSLHGVHFANALNGWAVGDGGLILSTRNGGETWQAQKSGISENLYGISSHGVNLSDGSEGWAVGSRGTIIKTSDGGESWKVQPGPTSQNLWGVCFVDAHTGWAVGDGGVIQVTHDGGKTWRVQTSPTDHQLLGINFIDDRSGWAVGFNKEILRTHDGGESWQARDTGSPLPVPQLFGVDERTFLIFAVAIGSLGFLGVAWLVWLWRRDRMRLQYELESLRFRVERQAVAVQKPPELTEGAPCEVMFTACASFVRNEGSSGQPVAANSLYPKVLAGEQGVMRAFEGLVESIAQSLDDRAELSAFARRIVANHRGKRWIEAILET